jgi:hypothetical protein
MGVQIRNFRPKGFILIYTLWVLAACSVLLALLAKSAVRPIEVNEAALTAPIALVEEINILDYVLAHTFSHVLQVDPRFLSYQKELSTEGIRARKGLVQELKGMLSQIGMKLEIDDDASTGEESTSRTITGRAEVETEALTTFHQRTQFNVSKDPYRIKPGDVEYQVMIRPANALPSINTLPRAAMIRYLTHLGLERGPARRLAGVIHDWIDVDDFISEEGAESSQYPFGHAPRNGPIQSWSEIYYLKGSSSQLIAFLRNHFTLRSQQQRVSANYLDSEVLAVLADIPTSEVVIALENQALTEEEKLPLVELIGKAHAEQFASLVDWKDDQSIVRITISGPLLRLSALFDTRHKQIIDWYLD